MAELGRRQQAKADTRARLVHSTLAVALKSPERLRVGDIAEHAGVSHGTFYLHFPSLDLALAEVQRELAASLATAAAEAGADVHEGIRRYVEAAFGQSAEIAAAWRLSSGRKGAATTAPSAGAEPDLLASWLQRVLDPENQTEVSMVSRLLATMVEESTLRAVLAGEEGQRAELVDALASLLTAKRGARLSGTEPSSHAARAQRPAIIVGDRQITHAELEERAARASILLHELGLREGDRVCQLLQNGFAAVELVVGSARLGLTMVPLNTYWRTQEVAHVLRTSGAKGLAFHDDFRSVVDSLPTDLLRNLSLLPVGGARTEERYEAELGRATGDPPPRATTAGTLWFTSGSTALPKGILRHETASERRRHAMFQASLFGYDETEVILIGGPLHHAANRHFAYIAMELGATMVLIPHFDAEEVLQLVERHRITSLLVVPTMLYRLVQLDPGIVARYDLSSLRTIIHMAAPCAVDLKHRVMERFGPIVHEYYGATEIGGTYIGPRDWLAHPGSVGRAWSPETEVRIVDPDGNALPPEVVGDVAIVDRRRPPFTYLEGTGPDEEYLTADGLFITGDLGRLDRDGYLYLADRRSAVIKSGGVSIYPAEVEAVLNEHPAVQDAAVSGVPDPEWGERVVAFVQPRNGAEVDPSRLAEFVRARLAHYKCPREWVVVDAVPRDAAGKLMRRELATLGQG